MWENPMTKIKKNVIFLTDMKIEIKVASSQVRFLNYFGIFLILASCSPKNEDVVIIPPVTFPLSKPYIAYGVINISYTQLNNLPKDNNSQNGISFGYLRKGSIVNILERKQENIDGKIETWVLVQGEATGWIKESLVDIYENERQAQTASQIMKY